MVRVNLPRDVDEAFTAARVDSPRRPVKEKAVEHRHGRDGRDDGAGIRIEHDNAGGGAHTQKETVVFLVEVESDVFLDPGNRPLGYLDARLSIEDYDLRLFRYEDIQMPATLVGDTAARMRVRDDRGDLGTGHRAQHR